MRNLYAVKQYQKVNAQKFQVNNLEAIKQYQTTPKDNASYESFYKGLILINLELRQIFHLLIYLLTYSFISIQHYSKIFPKKEIEIKVVDFA